MTTINFIRTIFFENNLNQRYNPRVTKGTKTPEDARGPLNVQNPSRISSRPYLKSKYHNELYVFHTQN